MVIQLSFHVKPNLYIRDLTLNISDIDRAVTFYTDILGFKVLHQEEKKVILTVDGKTPILTLLKPVGVTAKESRRTGLYHFAMLLPSRADLGSFLLNMIQKGQSIPGASDHLVSEALYLSDPDGNGIEIYWDRPAVTWTWKNNQVAMSTDPLDAESLLAEGATKAWNGMPTDTIIGHIHLHVADLQAAVEYYTKVFGYEVVCEYGGQAAFLSTGGYHHHIALNTWNGIGAHAPSENSVGMKEFSIVLPTEDYKQNVIESLKTLNSSFLNKDENLYTNDPSNNHIALVLE